MLKNLSADNIYIVCGHTDMRKSIDGLAGIVQQQYQLDLFNNSVFLFCGRRRDRLKVLLWEDLSAVFCYPNIFMEQGLMLMTKPVLFKEMCG